jgi:hypothetical protein
MSIQSVIVPRCRMLLALATIGPDRTFAAHVVPVQGLVRRGGVTGGTWSCVVAHPETGQVVESAYLEFSFAFAAAPDAPADELAEAVRFATEFVVSRARAKLASEAQAE